MKGNNQIIEFAFYLVSGQYYEVDVLSMPSYGGRRTDEHSTHRLPSNYGNEYRVCVGDATSMSSFSEARHWASQWAEHSMQYINFGTPFPNS